jgi:general stress protein YciG
VNEQRKERRGFASMSPEKQREIASKGGRAAHQKGTAHEWSSDEAREAGRKGGMASRGGRGKLPITSTPSVTPGAPVGSPTDTEPAA